MAHRPDVESAYNRRSLRETRRYRRRLIFGFLVTPLFLVTAAAAAIAAGA